MVFGTALSLVVCMLILDSQEDDSVRVVHSGLRHYCGRDLTTALSVVCDGWYKRSTPEADSNDVSTDDSGDEFWFLLSPVLSRQQALTMLQVGEYSRNKRKGIINECCKRPCSVDHLKQYCGDEEE